MKLKFISFVRNASAHNILNVRLTMDLTKVYNCNFKLLSWYGKHGNEMQEKKRRTVGTILTALQLHLYLQHNRSEYGLVNFYVEGNS
jgi:hypothetical protein